MIAVSAEKSALTVFFAAAYAADSAVFSMSRMLMP